jgi:hypothetical protein
MTTPREFGPRLKAMRERREITLESIAESTKIGMPLLEALERSDVSHWPKGIFRRAFFRDYATAIGAPVEEMLHEFSRLFPEHGPVITGAPLPAPLRMTLATVPPRIQPWTMRILAGLADAVLVVLLGVAAAWSLALEWSTGVAAAGCLYYPLTAMWLGRSPVLHWVHGNGTVNRAWWTARASTPHVSAARPVTSELIGEETPAAGSQGERRTGLDRRRAAFLAHAGSRFHRKRVRNAQGLRGMNPRFHADERLPG